MPYTVPKLTDFSTSALDSAVSRTSSALEQESAAVKFRERLEGFPRPLDGAKNGILTQLNDLWLKAAPGRSKPDVGQRVNELKTKVEHGLYEAPRRPAFKWTPAAN